MKVNYISILSVISLSAIAANAQASPFNGPYIGVMGGYESIHDSASDTGKGAFAGISSSGTLSAAGGNAGLFAGYGKTFGNLYLGAEAEGDVADSEEKTRITSGGSVIFSDTRHKYDYGASLRAGFMPTETTLLYGRIGGIWSEFDSKAVSNNVNLAGLRLGLGSEVAIAQNITARLDWVYTVYDSSTYTDVNQIAVDKPTSNTFRVGLAYNF